MYSCAIILIKIYVLLRGKQITLTNNYARASQ